LHSLFLSLVLADAAAAAFFAPFSSPLVLADAAAAALFAPVSPPLMLAEAATAAVFAHAPLPLVLAKFGLASVTLEFRRVSLLLDSLCRRCLFRGPLCLAQVFVTRLVGCETNPR